MHSYHQRELKPTYNFFKYKCKSRTVKCVGVTSLLYFFYLARLLAGGWAWSGVAVELRGTGADFIFIVILLIKIHTAGYSFTGRKVEGAEGKQVSDVFSHNLLSFPGHFIAVWRRFIVRSYHIRLHSCDSGAIAPPAPHPPGRWRVAANPSAFSGGAQSKEHRHRPQLFPVFAAKYVE